MPVMPTLDSAPLISVVVPLFNEAARLPRLWRALAEQTYANFEVLFVDNGSRDQTLAVAAAIGDPRVLVLQELATQGPDAARNVALKVARGDWLAFTDGDCLPEPTWLANLAAAALRADADLVAGRIALALGGSPSAAELYDSVTFLQQASAVRDRGVAFTANLLVHRRVFQRVGPFPVDRGWNGDMLFTRGATKLGCTLVYSEDAVVHHPTRPFREIIRKSWRIALGKGAFRAAASGGARTFFFEPKPHIRHLDPRRLRASLVGYGRSPRLSLLFSASCVAWLVAVTGFVGFAWGRYRHAADAVRRRRIPEAGPAELRRKAGTRGLLELVYRRTIGIRLGLVTVASRCLWAVAGRRGVSAQAASGVSILFVAKDRLALDYALSQAVAVARLPNVGLFVTAPRRLRKLCLDRLRETARAVTFVPLSRALLCRWNLICFPSHFLGPLFHPASPKVYTSHGIQSGSCVFGGRSYAYGWKALRNCDSTYYDAIFATHDAERNVALAEPWGDKLADKIKVVGNVAASELLRRNDQREVVRRGLGIAPDRRVLTFMSTWDGGCLLEQVGTQLLREASALRQEYELFVSAHPRALARSEFRALVAKFREQGVTIVPTGPEAWRDYLVATDVVVTDRTSLGLYFALLRRPMAFVPLREDAFANDGSILDLYRRHPRITPGHPLLPQVNRLDRPVAVPAWLQSIAEESRSDHRFERAVLELILTPGRP